MHRRCRIVEKVNCKCYLPIASRLCVLYIATFCLFSGIDVVHKAIDVAVASCDPTTWRTCLIEITVSSVRCTDCMVKFFS